MDSQLDLLAWYGANSASQTRPVGQKQASNLGLHDMHGNVREWCEDWYGDYPSGAVTDPHGPTSGTYRVLRGGSLLNYSNFCRASDRAYLNPGFRFNSVGFRAARTP